MKEKDWLALSPLDMLTHLTESAGAEALRYPISGRKLRLLAVACCRAVWNKLNQVGKAAVKVAEEAADGQAGTEELTRAGALVRESPERQEDDDVIRTAVAEAEYCCAEPANAASFVLRPLRIRGNDADRLLLLEVFGNPYRPVRRSDGRCPHCRPRRELVEADGGERCPKCKWFQFPLREGWLTRDVVQLATLAYEKRKRFGKLDNGALAALSDALEEAGCTNRPALDHLRGRRAHYRGCHVLDCVLGKD
jgi:hypothetical protein